MNVGSVGDDLECMCIVVSDGWTNCCTYYLFYFMEKMTVQKVR